MSPLTVKSLRNLCLRGIISINDYYNWKKMKSHRNRRKLIQFNRGQFVLSNFSDDESLILFRFNKHEINRLIKALGIPPGCSVANGTKFSGTEGLCILLRRLCYPNRLAELVKLFNRDPTTLSRIFNWVLKFIFVHHGHLLATLEQPWINEATFEEFAQSCKEAGSYYPNIIGFIDGTARPICRPKYCQKNQYSGYKKQHVIKYQSVVYPNGIIGRLDGPFNGKRHDSAILNISRLKNEMGKLFNSHNSSYALYGDTGYSNQKFVKVGFKNYNRLSNQQKLFNADMSALRVSVEYGFGKIVQQFAFLDFKKNQKLYMNQLKMQYHVAAILVNCQTCIRGNQISQYFDCMPPILDVYLNN